MRSLQANFEQLNHGDQQTVSARLSKAVDLLGSTTDLVVGDVLSVVDIGDLDEQEVLMATITGIDPDLDLVELRIQTS